MVKTSYKRKAPRQIARPRKMMRRAARRIPRSVSMPAVTVQRTWWSGNWTPSTTTTADFWRFITVNLGACPNVTEYTALFDSYKVQSVTFILRPRYDGFNGENTTDTTLPGVTNQGATRVHVLIDPKSIVSPTGTYTSATLNTFLEQGSKVRTYSGSRAVTIPIRYPVFIDDINGTAASMYKSTKTTWFSTANTGITVRGAHVFLQDINLTGVFGQSFDIFTTMTVSFKGMR
jgi:hypothetical protein